jgi:hypothetical protein
MGSSISVSWNEWGEGMGSGEGWGCYQHQHPKVCMYACMFREIKGESVFSGLF